MGTKRILPLGGVAVAAIWRAKAAQEGFSSESSLESAWFQAKKTFADFTAFLMGICAHTVALGRFHAAAPKSLDTPSLVPICALYDHLVPDRFDTPAGADKINPMRMALPTFSHSQWILHQLIPLHFDDQRGDALANPLIIHDPIEIGIFIGAPAGAQK